MAATLTDEQKIAKGREMAEAWRALDWRKVPTCSRPTAYCIR